MSQPFDRSCKIPPPGTPNEKLGEFWEESPWTIASNENLSAFERNRFYINFYGENFFDSITKDDKVLFDQIMESQSGIMVDSNAMNELVCSSIFPKRSAVRKITKRK